MIYRLMEELNVCPPGAVVKVGDTIADIESGLNAGVWSVGVTQTGNMLGLSEKECTELSLDELNDRHPGSRAKDAECRCSLCDRWCSPTTGSDQ